MMQCSEFEIRLCEFLDGTLAGKARMELEEHAAQCGLCAALLADSRAAQRFLSTVEDVAAPPELVTAILYRTHGAWPPAQAASAGWRAWIEPLLQPRYVMGMAMTILSVSMLYRVAGVEIRQLELGDLNPVQIWANVDNSAHRIWNRGVKFYQNARFVYEIMTQWRAMQADDAEAGDAEKAVSGDSAGAPPGAGTVSQPRKIEPSAGPSRARRLKREWTQ
jgi:hypothetical protein